MYNELHETQSSPSHLHLCCLLFCFLIAFFPSSSHIKKTKSVHKCQPPFYPPPPALKVKKRKREKKTKKSQRGRALVGSFNPKCLTFTNTVTACILIKFGYVGCQVRLTIRPQRASLSFHHKRKKHTSMSEPWVLFSEQSSLITGLSSLCLSHPPGTDSTFDFNPSRNQCQ